MKKRTFLLLVVGLLVLVLGACSQKEKQEAKKVMLEATKKSVEADKKVEQMIYKMYEDGFSFEQISNYCSLSVDELKSLIKS